MSKAGKVRVPPPELRVVPWEWSPRRYQVPLWGYLQRGGKRAVAVWHRRSGKDSLCLNWAAVAAVQRPATYWHMLPQASQARKAIWEAVNPHTGKRVIDQAFPHWLRTGTRENEMMIRLRGGATWQVVGSDNFDSLVGSPPAGVVFSEYALADPRAWGIMRPILAENDGWALFVSTPRGRNHLHDILQQAQSEPGWFGQLLPATVTGVFSRPVLAQELKELCRENGEQDGRSLYEQEYLCSFDAAIVGTYYSRWIEEAEASGRIGTVKHDPSIPVYTAWDLGIGDSTAIWFFQIAGPGEIRVIDYYEASGQGLDHYAEELASRGWEYAEDLVPHDAKVRELGTGRTRIETLQSLGRKPRLIPNHKTSDGVQAVRTTLPLCWFDRERCERGLDALRQYRREWDDKYKVFSNRALHDWASHGADAFRYLAMGWRDAVPEAVTDGRWVETPRGRKLVRDPKPPVAPTLDQLFSDAEKHRFRSAGRL